MPFGAGRVIRTYFEGELEMVEADWRDGGVLSIPAGECIQLSEAMGTIDLVHRMCHLSEEQNRKLTRRALEYPLKNQNGTD